MAGCLRAPADLTKGVHGDLSELAAGNGGRGAAGGAQARSRNVLIAGARRRGRARAAGPRARLSAVREPSPWPGDERPWGALGSGSGGWVWGGNPAHLGGRMSDWLLPPTPAGALEPRRGRPGFHGPWVHIAPVSGELRGFGQLLWTRFSH